MLDWNDLRHFLAVADKGSTLAAAKVLRVSQPTVVRRIAALERALGMALFERSRSGYRLTDAGLTILPVAQRMAAVADELSSRAEQAGRDIAGAVRVTTPEIFAAPLLAPLIASLRQDFPQLTIDLDLSNNVRDIASGDADIALRSAIRLTGDGLYCRRVGDDRWGYYCSRGYAERFGIPRSPAELAGHQVIGDGEPDPWHEFDRWRQEQGIVETLQLRNASLSALHAAARSGQGLALLPASLFDRDPDMIRCFLGPDTGHGLWLVVHERSRRLPHVRLVVERIGEALRTSLASS